MRRAAGQRHHRNQPFAADGEGFLAHAQALRRTVCHWHEVRIALGQQ